VQSEGSQHPSAPTRNQDLELVTPFPHGVDLHS
jgi:hypothetical protein